MTRANIEGMIRTALTTHHAKHGVMLPAVDEYIDRLADAIEGQQKRDSEARLTEASRAVKSIVAGEATTEEIIRTVTDLNNPSGTGVARGDTAAADSWPHDI